MFLVPFPKNLQRRNILPTPGSALFQLCLQLCGCMQLQILIRNSERRRRERSRPIDCFQSLLEQILIVVNAPPTFTIEGVGDIELRCRITLGGVSALPLIARGAKLLASKERERGLKLLLIDLVSTGRHLSSGGHLLEAARLGRI